MIKICMISDTHGKHKNLKLEPADILIFSGDFMNSGRNILEAQMFLTWFDKLDQFKYKILVAGNHDILVENNFEQVCMSQYKNVIYLQDSSAELWFNDQKINIYGSPFTPEFYDWAFMLTKEQAIEKWKEIPKNTDILVTHGPPYQILDKSRDGINCGCQALLQKVFEIQPKLHVFGHIHEAYGIVEKQGISFINASILNYHYQVANKAVYVIFDLLTKQVKIQ